MHPNISVIVPIYKAESYLHRCIDSLLAQTFTNFELILVDDGSPDRCGAISDEYAKKDCRIKVIHKINGGVASARQCGIDNATGTYTIHVDPDDWVDPTMLEELYNKAIQEKADMVICDFWWEDKSGIKIFKQEPSYMVADKIILDLLFDRLFGSLCNKLIKRTYYINNITFIKGLNICEDLLVCIKVLAQVPTIAYINKAFYHYDQYSNTHSITHQFNVESYKTYQRVIKEIQLILKEKKYIQGINYRKACIAVLCIGHSTFTSKEYKNIYKNEYKELLPYIKRTKSKIEFIIAANGFLFAVKIFSPIINAISKFIRKVYNFILH